MVEWSGKFGNQHTSPHPHSQCSFSVHYHIKSLKEVLLYGDLLHFDAKLDLWVLLFVK